MAPDVLTVADRLNRAIARLSPEMAARVQNGWGPAGAPYFITTLVNDRRRITVVDAESGEAFSGTGATVAEAVAKLEARIAHDYPEAPDA